MDERCEAAIGEYCAARRENSNSDVFIWTNIILSICNVVAKKKSSCGKAMRRQHLKQLDTNRDSGDRRHSRTPCPALRGRVYACKASQRHQPTLLPDDWQSPLSLHRAEILISRKCETNEMTVPEAEVQA